jgi:hypothetical protein
METTNTTSDTKETVFVQSNTTVKMETANQETTQEWHDKNIQALRDQKIINIKQLRKDTDEIIQRVKSLKGSREISLVVTNLQQAVMWLGMELKEMGTENPYPNSKNPNNTIIEPTADGLKL